MNEGEAIGLLIGLAVPPKPERPLLFQHWDWSTVIVQAIDKTKYQPDLRAMVVEAVAVLIDLPVSDPQEVSHEVTRRRSFNTIRGRSGDARFQRPGPEG